MSQQDHDRNNDVLKDKIAPPTGELPDPVGIITTPEEEVNEPMPTGKSPAPGPGSPRKFSISAGRIERPGKWVPYAMLLPSMALLIVFTIWPIINNVRQSFVSEETGEFTFANYTYYFTDEIMRANIIYTLEIVIVTVILVLVIGYLLALYMRFSKTRIAGVLRKIYILPRFVPGLVAVNGMITVIRDSGLINRIGRLFGQNWQLGLMYDMKGIILMNLWFNIPFVAMILASALSSIQDPAIEAARDVGANKLTIFGRFILPLTYKDILIAATFVFMGNISSFTTPYLMGGNHPKMLGIQIYTDFGNTRYERAAALAVIMFIFSGISAATYIYTNLRESEWERAR